MLSNPFRISADICIGCDTTPQFSLSRAMGCRSGAYGFVSVDYVDAVEQQRLLAISVEDKKAKDNCDGRLTAISSVDI